MKTVLENWDSNVLNSIVAVGPINEVTKDLIIRSDKVNDVKEGLIREIDSRINLYKRYNSPTGDALTIEFF
jgi:hypothetical protein